MKNQYFTKALLTVLIIIFSTVFIPSSLSAFSDDAETIFSDDFNDNSLDLLNWTEDNIDPGCSFQEINQEANFTTNAGHSLIFSKVLNISNWEEINISGKWKFTNPNTAEMRCRLIDNVTNDFVGVTYATWNPIGDEYQHIRFYNNSANYEEDSTMDIPTAYADFNIVLTNDTFQYWEDGLIISELDSTVLAATTHFKLQIGGYDASPGEQYMYFDDISINVTYLDSPTAPSNVSIDDDYDDATPGWGETHFTSIQEGINAVNDTGTVNINNGIYDEFVTVNKTITITGETIDGVVVNGTFYLQNDSVIIENLTIVNATEGDFPAGIYVESSQSLLRNLKINNCTNGISISSENDRTNITGCIIENNEYGIDMRYTFQNNISGNYIIDNSIGLYFYYSNQNMIFNNYFDNIQDVEIIDEGPSVNLWNRSFIVPGLNIIGGANLGGNYWDDYSGFDFNADGIGDTPYLIYSDEGENSYFDYFPLTNNQNEPPTLGIPDPNDESTDNPLELTWAIPINDDEGFFSWTITCSNGQSISSGEDSNGTKILTLTNLDYSTTYTITVNITDWYLWTNQTFTFTTESKPNDPKPKPPKINDPPVARPGGPYFGSPNEQLFFDGSSSYDNDGYLVSYNWNFGDGTNAQGASITHLYSKPGSYTVTLSVTDNQGKTASSRTTAVIVKPNNPPEIQSDVSTDIGKLSIQLTVTVTDKDDDPLSCSISWGDGSSSADLSMSNGESRTETHTYQAFGSYDIDINADDGTAVTVKGHKAVLYTDENDDQTTSGFGGFSPIEEEDEEFIENQIDERSLFGKALEKNYVIPAATAASILLLFLLNLLIEFLSDYSSEHALDFRGKKKDETSKEKPMKTFLSKGELLAVLLTTILFALVLSWTWTPDFSMFWTLFLITLLIVAVIILIRETLRCYLCRKEGIYSEFYIWPLGAVMMIVSTVIGNTFSLAANHQYDEQGDIKKCGRVNFIVSLFMFLVVLASFILNIFYPSIVLQMIVIVSVLNLFIDLFPFRPMDGFEIRKWNVFVWLIFYVIVIAFYVMVYFNLYP